jgi:glycosyltransferase involved in cell wall biosynthesis
MKTITIDIRLINNSGIGTYIKNIVPAVINFFPELHFNLLIDSTHINTYSEFAFNQKNVTSIECKSKLYSVHEQLEVYKSIPKNTDIFWSPHYVIPILYSKTILVTIHDVCHLAFPEFSSGFFKEIYAKLMMHYATTKAVKVITDSHFSKQEIVRFASIKPELVNVIHLGVINELHPPLSNIHDLSCSPYIVFLGNVKPNKNLVRLLKAFSKLMDVIPHRLLIVGKKDGFIGKDLDVFEYANNLGDRIEFTGFIDDIKLKETLRNADALIFPSIYEGFGFPPLEAMSCGCPVAASSAASIPEICGDAAIYFDPYDIDDMAKTIFKLVTNKTLSQSLVTKGAQRINDFSWELCIKKTCKLIENLIEEN